MTACGDGEESVEGPDPADAVSEGDGDPSVTPDGDDTPPPPEPPQVLALDKTTLTIGEPLRFFVRGAPARAVGRLRLQFEGTFTTGDDSEPMIPFAVTPLLDGVLKSDGSIGDTALPAGTSAMRWSRFGPWSVPFLKLWNKAGTFKGSILPMIRLLDGELVAGPPIDITIVVVPSVAVTRFEPIGAGCLKPALRIHGGLPYVVEVEAVGLDPKSFTWEIDGLTESEGTAVFTHTATGPTDRLGGLTAPEGESIVFAGVPDGKGFAAASIRVRAEAADGTTVETAIPVRVVRRLGVHFDGEVRDAEHFAPVLVTGPADGGFSGVLKWNDGAPEARMRSVDVVFEGSLEVDSSGWPTGTSSGTLPLLAAITQVPYSDAESAFEVYGTSYQKEVPPAQLASADGVLWSWAGGEARLDTLLATASIPGATKGVGFGGPPLLVTDGDVSPAWAGLGLQSMGAGGVTFGSVTMDGPHGALGGTWLVQPLATSRMEAQATVPAGKPTAWSLGGGDDPIVSTAGDTTLIATQVPVPDGQCAAIWRQTTRTVRQAAIVRYGACGTRALMGVARFTDWTFAAASSIGKDCDALETPDGLKTAACLEACE